MERKRNYEPVHEDYVEAVDQQQQSDFYVLNSEMVSLIESPSFVQSFSELATTSERIKFVLSHEAVTRLIANVVVRDNLDDDKKSYTKAAEFGQACVRALQVDLYEEALTSQSSAIRYAPQDGSLLPIAFGNRSGAFFLLKQYEAALKDIEAAETHPLYKPDFLLTIRKCQCYVRLGRVAQAKQILDSIKRDDLNKGDAVLLNKFYKEEGDNLKDVDEEEVKEEGESKNKDIEDPELLKNVSSVIKILSEKGRFEPQSSNSSLSSKVEVRYGVKNGGVHFGDILAVTKSYASVLTEKQEQSKKGEAALLDKFYKQEGDHLKDVDEEIKGESMNKNNEDPELLKHVSSVIKILSENGRFEPQSSNSSLSSKVEVRYDEKNGRHLVTTEDVHFGDILAVTKPYAAVLTPKQELHFCHHCLTSLESIPDIYPRTVPCTDCTRVLYCSEHCRIESWKEYHRFECSLAWNSFDASIVDNSNAVLNNYRLALRTLFVAGGLESICSISQKFPTTDRSKSADFTDNPADYYENIYRMEMKECNNIKEHVMNIISIACLFEWSKLAEINDEDKAASRNVASEKDIFAIETLLRHYLQITNRVTPFLRSDQSALDDPTATVEFITTLDPLIGLMKESFHPNTSIIVADCARAAPHVSNVCVFFVIKPIPAGTVLSTVGQCYGDSVMYRIFLGGFVPGEQLIQCKSLSKFICPCDQNCEDKPHDNPLGSIPTSSSSSSSCPFDGHELVCCSTTCGGFIRRTDDEQVKCCTCQRDIGPDELADLKNIYLDLSRLHSQAKVLFGLIKTLIENSKDVGASVPKELYTFLLRLETLINDRIAPLALKHSRLLLVHLYRQLSAFYRHCYMKEANKFDHLQKAWKYAEEALTTLEAHFGGFDSLDVMMQLRENANFFSKESVFVRFVLEDPHGQFAFLNLDDNRGERRNILVRFVERYDAAQGRLHNMNEYYKLI